MAKKRKKTDVDLMKKKADELGQGKYFKPKEGKNIVRVLPPWNDEGSFYLEASLHYGLQHEGRERTFPCLGKKCPVCKFAKNISDTEIVDRLRPRKKFYSNIIDKNTGQVMIWGYSAKILRELLGYLQDPDWGDFTDEEEGHDIVVERTGSGKNDTRYSVRIKPKPTEISVEDWEEKLIDLSAEVIEPISPKELAVIVEANFGELEEDKDDEEEEDDDDDEDDEEEEEDDEDEEKEEDDDEDEEEPTKKKRDRKRRKKR